LEGLVRNEDGREIELDIGYGTVTLQKADIDRIQRSPEKERQALLRRHRSRSAESGQWVPKGSEKLSELFRKLREAREQAFEASRRKESLSSEQAELEAELADLKQRYPPLAQEMNQAAASDQRRYNSLVRELNALSASMQAQEIRLESVKKDILDAGEGIHLYLNAYGEFRRRFREEEASLRGRQPGAGEMDFHEGIRRAMAEMERDFSQESVPSARRRGGHLVVKAVLNGRVAASLLVDTCASMTVISPKVAERLELGRNSVLGMARISMADGRSVQAPLVRLDSVSVGGMRVERSPAAILPAVTSGVDGLLGMSFLGNFVVQVGGKDDRLILRRLKPGVRRE